jgi:hypothetical protein
LVEDHAALKDCPARTLPGLNVILAVGGAGGSTLSVMGGNVTLGFRSAGLQDIDSW